MCKRICTDTGTTSVKSSEGLFEYDYDIVCQSFYLSDNLTEAQYETWFSSKCINVLNKTCCGNGGTTGFINYARKHFKGILILVPNVSICKSKEVEYEGCDDVCCCYGGSENFSKDATVVIATYDQFHRMMKELDDYAVKYNDDWSSTLWSGRTILIDEYHKITDECSFRDVCFDCTRLIKEQNNGVILMSATPHWGFIDFLREYLPEKEIKTYTIRYEDEEDLLIDREVPRQIQVYDVHKKLADIIKKVYKSGKNKQIVVFYNNRSDIKKFLVKMGVKDVEVLCSSQYADEFGKYYSNTFNPEKKLHFLTSAYFTGCDINVHVQACIIIGSKSHSFLSYNSREIKQMIGRFREGCTAVHLFYNGKTKNIYDYTENKTAYDKCKRTLEKVGDEWTLNKEAVVEKQRSIMLKDRLDDADKWRSLSTLKKMLAEAGYKVRECKMKEFETICATKKLTAVETKERLIRGEEVDWDENAMSGQYKAYLDRYGADALRKASASDVKNWYKIRKNVGEEEDLLSAMLPNELFDALGLCDGYYSGSFLMDCLKYVGVKCKREELTYVFKETFGAYAVRIAHNIKDKKSGRTREEVMYMVLNVRYPGKSSESAYINDFSTKNQEISHFSHKPLISLNHKKASNGSLLAKTYRLDTMTFQSLSDINLYKWVMEDKKNRLPLVKGDKDKEKKWKVIKNFQQSKISEMYKLTTNQYPFKKDQMEYIDLMICDIDSGLPFSSFKKMYAKYRWTAYPTLNNAADDWMKYRIVIPLDTTIKIKGEQNLKVLKLLRNMFCPYEDPEHGLFSYVNNEDWECRYENNGELYHIEQSLVDDLLLRVANIRDFYDKAHIKDKGIVPSKEHFKDLEWAERYFKGVRDSRQDNVAHSALYIIKKNLSPQNRNEFERWLAENYGARDIQHWRSHRV